MEISEIDRLRFRIRDFMSKLEVKAKDKCWEWIGAKIPCGYGQFRVGDKRIQSHRFSYLLFYGKIDAELLTCHTCDNKGCVNPFHLFQGTQKDNMQDKVNKGRCGDVGRKRIHPLKIKSEIETRGRKSLLSDEDKKTILELKRRGYRQKSLAIRFRVSEGIISYLCRKNKTKGVL